MTKVILDIETMGYDFDSLDEESQKYLLKYAENEEEEKETKQRMSLWAPTAQILVIGLLNPETNKGVIYYQNNNQAKAVEIINDVEYKSGTEKEILEGFWQSVRHYDKIITFNGRGFDCPFLMVRSAILGVKATKNLMPYRYSVDSHIDLLEQLTFYGASRKFDLAFFCKTFGIPSPKSEFTGLDLPKLYQAARFLDIAKYNYGDLVATKQLYDKWEKFINIK